MATIFFASDGYVNAKRGNWPFGEVGVVTYQSSNGSKLGYATSDLNYTGTVFEPVDQFKGDLARVYFTWQHATSMTLLTGKATPVALMQCSMEPRIKFLNHGHLRCSNAGTSDPVDQKERDRNEAVFQFQNNRNPFVDHPEFVEQIWGH